MCLRYFESDGGLCHTVVVSGFAGAFDAIRSPNIPMDAIAMIVATTAEKKITLPSFERAGPDSCRAQVGTSFEHLLDRR
jgi:hypothetical protein